MEKGRAAHTLISRDNTLDNSRSEDGEEATYPRSRESPLGDLFEISLGVLGMVSFGWHFVRV